MQLRMAILCRWRDDMASLAGGDVTIVDGSRASLSAAEDAAPPHAVSVAARRTTARITGRRVIAAIMHERRTARDASNGPRPADAC